MTTNDIIIDTSVMLMSECLNFNVNMSLTNAVVKRQCQQQERQKEQERQQEEQEEQHQR